ncbi:MAG: TolC family protein [Candidatus Omnitrophica bacterium]|nr:TolC family protein [Candidatus Omnitrophota bacterium]
MNMGRRCSVFITYCAAVILFCVPRQSEADETISWEDSVREARSGHPDLVSASEKINQSISSKNIAESAYLPNITGTVSELTAKKGSSRSGSQSSETTASSSAGTAGPKKNHSTQYDYGVDGKQLIFDGFKTVNDIASAKMDITGAEYNYQVTSSNVRLRLRSAYVGLWAAEKILAVSEEIEASLRETLDLVRLRYEGGMEHKGALLTSESDLARAVFEVNQAKRAIYLAQRQLTKELGRDKFSALRAGGEFGIKDADRERPDFENICATVPILRQLAAQKEAAKYGVKSALGSFFPAIYATGSLGNSGTDVFPERNGWSAGTSLSIPRFEGGSNAASYQKAKAVFGQAEADEKSGRDGVIYTMANTWTVLENAIDNVDVTRIALKAAIEREKIAEAEYSLGLITYDNWIIIENNLVEAKRALIASERDALMAEANWVQAKGGTLDHDK